MMKNKLKEKVPVAVFGKASNLVVRRVAGRASGLSVIEEFTKMKSSDGTPLHAIEITEMLVKGKPETDRIRIYNNLAHACRTFNRRNPERCVKVRRGLRETDNTPVIQLYYSEN